MKNKTLFEQDADRRAQRLRQQTIQKLHRFIELQEDQLEMLEQIQQQQMRQPIQNQLDRQQFYFQFFVRSTARRLHSLRRQINQELDLEDSSAAERELIRNKRENEQLLHVQYQIVDLDEFNVLINDVFAP